MRKSIAALLILALLMGIPCVPAALGESRFTASTSLEDVSRSGVKNIERAASAINGVRVEAGGRFSFNETVGPRTKSQGYVPAENARGVSVTGGGVAQVATTLYLALLRLGDRVKFTQLSVYGSRFKGSYVSDGSKAVITDYSGGTDFEFANLTDDLTIEMWVSDTALNCVVSVAESGGDDWFGSWTDAPAATAEPDASVASAIVSASIPMSGDDGTLSNIALAAKAVNGTRLEPQATFSFNKVVGARSRKRGYEGGTNGRGVRVTGGGVAQVASVIWLAVKQMKDIAIVEKSTYGTRYNQSYVESSADAIVTDYQSGKDFAFRNTGGGAIVIYTSVEGGVLRCDIAYN